MADIPSADQRAQLLVSLERDLSRLLEECSDQREILESALHKIALLREQWKTVPPRRSRFSSST